MTDIRKRILTIDGGGVRGILALEILAQIQRTLREHYGNPRLVLADHFHFIAGASIGGIIASYLSWGESMERITELFLKDVGRMFVRMPWLGYLRGWIYDPSNLADFLRSFFKEDNGTPAFLGTEKLRTLLLLVLRNASTGSAWPVTNNPNAKYNQRGLPDCNLDLPLWQLVRAGAAAPFFYPPEEIAMGGQKFLFVDGGITPYNNPSVIAFLSATLPCYGLAWETGVDKLHIVSVGTGGTRTVLGNERHRLAFLRKQFEMVPNGLMETIAVQQDMLCRVLGDCIFGAPIDSEVGPIVGEAAGSRQFSYVRYNHFFTQKEIDTIQRWGGKFNLNNPKLIPPLRELGATYAQANVAVTHLL